MVNLLNVLLMNNGLRILGQIRNVLNDAEFLRCAQHHIYAFNFSNLHRFQLGITAHNGNVSIRRILKRFLHHLTAFLICMFSYRAGIDYIYICPRCKIHHRITGISK
ncbi:hypothetical protein D3C71_1397990 [compost metagenome]